MTASNEKPRDDASHNEADSHEQKLKTARDKTQQGVVNDGRGQEQPLDKKRAQENR
jgi:hypothetical protein